MTDPRLTTGRIKRIHVDQHRIRAKQRDCITIQTSSGPIKAESITIHGASKMVYRPEKPLSCGARLWVETHAFVEVNE